MGLSANPGHGLAGLGTYRALTLSSKSELPGTAQMGGAHVPPSKSDSFKTLLGHWEEVLPAAPTRLPLLPSLGKGQMSQEKTNPPSTVASHCGAPQTWVLTPPGGHLEVKLSNQQTDPWGRVLVIYHASSQCPSQSRKTWPNVRNPETTTD